MTPTAAPEETKEVALPEDYRDRQLMVVGKVKFTGVAAIMPKSLKYEEWREAVAGIGALREVARWWMGDLMNAGESRWGEKYSEALELSGLNEGTLRNICSIASKFPAERRRPELSWTHHRTAAALPPDVADELLTRAVAEGLTAPELAGIVREMRGDTAESTPRAQRTAAASNGNLLPDEVVPHDPDVTPFDPDKHWQCGEETCDAYYDVAAYHCYGCGRHISIDVEKCPACYPADQGAAATSSDDSDDAPMATTSSPATTAVTGSVITAADRTGADAASVLSEMVHLYTVARDIDVESMFLEAVSPTYPASLNSTLGSLVGLREYIDRLISTFSEDRVSAARADIEAETNEDREDVADLLAELTADESEVPDEADDDSADEPMEPATVDASPVVVDQAAVARDLNAKRNAAKNGKGAVRSVPKPGATKAGSRAKK